MPTMILVCVTLLNLMDALYPCSGTARIVEIAWLLMNDIDVEKANNVYQTKRHIYLDMCDPDFKSVFQGTVKLPPGGAALAKTHFPQHLMQEHTKRDTKIIVGMRNPKDNLLSLYHFYNMNEVFGNFSGSFSDFFTLIKEKRMLYGDIFEHNVGWWSIRDRPNTMYVFYEDLTEDPGKEVRRMAEFLGKETSDEDITKIVEWTTFGNMSQTKSTNYEELKKGIKFQGGPYMRKGTVGDWKNQFNEEQCDYIDEQYKQSCVPLGLKFRFEL
ncbi:hypothetical protein CAPTEDRAFT_5186 [Capitella teleta]|uniref:Sulfotransferase domain-containing protein n=1 Tax=Capitella teleta TaxID=283909 RepID=R7TNL4_CAPTE|nr:hypothetical protein CAPTEDRAFT_5186 [Capitella teleta]|eukprot:ELT92660.1 hypothetical protein CAPTEDRAFT_5186 [Capitella teleta]